jgi:uncharacterized damage-inducible protein DinB
MKEVERIADQLNRAITGSAWHGPAVLELLNGITAEQAAAHPISGAHSVWEIALHIDAWLRAGTRRLGGDRAQLTETEDWPAVSKVDEQAWSEMLNSIKQAYEQLRAAIQELEDSRLDHPIMDGMSSVYVTLHGVIQHSLYHAGQIALLKKSF